MKTRELFASLRESTRSRIDDLESRARDAAVEIARIRANPVVHDREASVWLRQLRETDRELAIERRVLDAYDTAEALQLAKDAQLAERHQANVARVEADASTRSERAASVNETLTARRANDECESALVIARRFTGRENEIPDHIVAVLMAAASNERVFELRREDAQRVLEAHRASSAEE
jgi:hypothetical protein